MSKFRNNKSNKNQGIQTIFGQHSVKAMNLKYKKLPFFLKMNLQEDLEMRTQHKE